MRRGACAIMAVMKSAFLSRRRPGFTLIELIIVIAILAVLASIAYPGYMSIAEGAKRTAAEKVCVDIATGVERYAQDNNGALPYDNTMAEPNHEDQIYLQTSENRDARLIQVLTNRETDDVENRLNTSRDTYLRSDEKQDKDKRDGLYVDDATGDVSLYDAWGQPYHIILCEEQEGCVDPFHPDRKRFRGKHCFVYSTGPDTEGAVDEAAPRSGKGGKKGGKKDGKKGGKKQSAKEKKAASAAADEAFMEAVEDNVYSWKKSSN